MFCLANPRLALAALLVLVLGAFTSACQRDVAPPLITATELSPAEAEIGDRLEISGNGFPKGKTARVTFRGALHRPGEPASAAEVEVLASAASAQRIEIVLTEPLEAEFCGRADRAQHTTFRGDVEVAFPAMAVGAPPVAATVANVTLDLRPASPSRAALEARRADADRMVAFMGLGFDDLPAGVASPLAGLPVRAVTAGSRAEAAGILADDVITSFDGVRVLSREDLVPSGARARVIVGIHREGTPDKDVDVAIDGYRLAAPRDLVAGGLLLLVAAGIVVFFFAPGTGNLAWFERRIASRALGLRAIVAGATSSRAPIVAACAASLLFAVMPFGRYVVLADLDIALLFLVAVTSLATIGFLTGGFRGAARIVSFEIPAALAIACVVLMTGSTRLEEIVRAQGGAPWSFYAFRSPITFLLFALHLTSALPQSRLVPGDVAEAESEPRRNPRGALAARASLIAEWANVLVTSGTSAALFLGGWRLPGMTLGQEGGRLELEILGSASFLLKAAALVVAVVLLRRALPVVKVEQTMRVCWRWLVPTAATCVVLTALWVAWSPSATVERILAMGTCALVVLACARLVHRVRFAARFGGGDNPTSAFL